MLAVFVAVILIMMPGSSASADSIIMASGTCGEHLMWTLDSNCHLEIFGTGDMENYDWDGAPWYDSNLRKMVKAVTISDGVTSIGNYAFYGCEIVSVVIPSSVTRIGNYAFYGNGTLKKVIIPASVETIGVEAFEDDEQFVLYGSNGSAAEMYARDNNIHFEGEHGTHKAVIDAAVAPTCTENGFGRGSHCSICGMIMSVQEYIPAYGHDFANDICIYCGQSYEEVKLRKFYESSGAGKTYELDSNLVLTSNFKIPREATLKLTHQAQLVIPEGITLEMSSASNIILNDGVLVVDGIISNQNSAGNNSVCITDSNDKLIINGSLDTSIYVFVYGPKATGNQILGNTNGITVEYRGKAIYLHDTAAEACEN